MQVDRDVPQIYCKNVLLQILMLVLYLIIKRFVKWKLLEPKMIGVLKMYICIRNYIVVIMIVIAVTCTLMLDSVINICDSKARPCNNYFTHATFYRVVVFPTCLVRGII